MESPEKKRLRLALECQLVKDLESMRNTLNYLSLKLHDLNFVVDSPQRKAAQELADACIARSQIRQH